LLLLSFSELLYLLYSHPPGQHDSCTWCRQGPERSPRDSGRSAIRGGAKARQLDAVKQKEKEDVMIALLHWQKTLKQYTGYPTEAHIHPTIQLCSISSRNHHLFYHFSYARDSPAGCSGAFGQSHVHSQLPGPMHHMLVRRAAAWALFCRLVDCEEPIDLGNCEFVRYWSTYNCLQRKESSGNKSIVRHTTIRTLIPNANDVLMVSYLSFDVADFARALGDGFTHREMVSHCMDWT